MDETRIIDFPIAEDDEGQALPSGSQLLNGKFKIEQQVGSGGFGITYLAKDIYLDRDVVIKECFPGAFCARFGTQVRVRSARYKEQHRTIVEMFMREARSIAKLRHPNIVSVHQVFEENQTAYMVLDLINGRDLLDIIEDESEPLSPDQVRDILVKTLDAIDLIHRNDLLHRDISPDNILLDKWGSPSLIDFGAALEQASASSGDVAAMMVVKDGYSPHEFYTAQGKQEPCSDLYALGATIYHLIAGEAPPNSQSRLSALADAAQDPYNPLAGRFPEYEATFLEALDKALSVPLKDRITSAKDWLSMIETESKKVKTVKIPTPKKVSQLLSELVQETNEHVLKSPPKRHPVEVRPVSLPKQDTYRPAWVEEFNRETTETESWHHDHGFAMAGARLLADVGRAAVGERDDTVHEMIDRGSAFPRKLLGWVSLTRHS